MSLALFHEVPAGAIEKIFDADGNPWFKWTHMGKFLDVKFFNTSMKNLDSKGACIQDLRTILKLQEQYPVLPNVKIAK